MPADDVPADDMPSDEMRADDLRAVTDEKHRPGDPSTVSSPGVASAVMSRAHRRSQSTSCGVSPRLPTRLGIAKNPGGE